VIVPVDALLRREVAEHRLRFTCEQCAHLDEGDRAGAERCSLGFPHLPHTSRTFEEAPTLAFCKAFELA
jgi:hypothetical protein